MPPYYEDAARLLRFLTARGLPLPNCKTHHQIIRQIALDMEASCHSSCRFTHAEAGERDEKLRDQSKIEA